MSIQAEPISGLVGRRFERREILLWSAAAIVALAAHVGTGWQAYRWAASAPPPAAEAAPAIMIDLAPMSVAAEAVPLDMPDTVDSPQTEASEEPVEIAEAVPVTDTKAEQVEEFDEVDPLRLTPVEEISPDVTKPVEPEPVEQAQPAEAAPEPPTETSEVVPETVEPTTEPTTTEAEEVIPDIVEAPLPEVAFAVPEPRPVEAEAEPAPAKRKPAEDPKPAKAKPIEKAKPVEKPKEAAKAPPKKQPSPKASVARTKSGQNAPRSATAAGNQGMKGSSMSPATWEAKVNAHMARGKRSLRARGKGTVKVRFSIGSGGEILTASVARSSGNAAFDQSAVDMVRRRSPIPAPPPGANRTLTIPIASQ
ncbi:TonB family protein [Mesorhizobium sp. LHD-90]|uniref:energy transducer TonB family protein n=1 Tax=Mesorhizobium sp. LHD-90 TaxID=3071414 RepID=UPI0027DFC467|nr:TonB family protein [Mesorhizobium sp. LHD-90]MDQ6438130.1 TonB family protein [Mesorhizobium sp. LHD-90]